MSLLYPKRRPKQGIDELDADVLRELRARTEARRKTYDMVTGPFSIQASDIGRRIRHERSDPSINSLVIAASLKRLRQRGLADYCSYGKGWHSIQRILRVVK